MWVSLLKQMDQKVVPRELVQRWGGDIESIERVSEGINFVFRFQRNGQNCYLRITHAKLRPKNELEAALRFQQYLIDNSVSVCRLAESIHGAWIEQCWQGEDEFLAHVCLGVPGKPIHFAYQENAIYKNWGRLLGQLHRAASKYSSQTYHYGQWENDLQEFDKYLENEDKPIKIEWQTVVSYLKLLPKTPDHHGLNHGDHRKANVLADGEQIHIIDFDLPRYCWWMDDISRPFFSNIMQKKPAWKDKLTPYLSGYRENFILPEQALMTFPWFLRYKALNLYLWLKNNWDSAIAPGGGSTELWLSQLRTMMMEQTWQHEVDELLSNKN